MSCGIYKITNLINGHSYIGQSIDIATRWCKHKGYNIKRSHYPLYKAFTKYGIENFKFEIIEECLKEQLDEREIYWISYYNTYKDGYNQTTGGQGSANQVIKLSNEDLMVIYDLLLHSDITQRQIALDFNVGEDTISEINNGKTRIQDGYSYPLRNNKRIKKYCLDCGKELSNKALEYCANCIGIHRRVVTRPSREELKQLIREKPFIQIGNQFNVSDNAIRKWCDSYNLPKTKKDIKNYTDKEWEQI